MPFTVKDIFRIEVAPALGCTEPVAIALGAAAAASLLAGEEIRAIEIWIDPNIYKNGIAVSIPGTPGLSGLDTAAAIGAQSHRSSNLLDRATLPRPLLSATATILLSIGI